MTPDQYRREGAEAMRMAAADMIEDECSFMSQHGMAQAIRAIDPAEVLAGLRTRCAECDCGDGDCTWIASGPAEGYEECICPAPCPIHPSPNAVARLVKALESGKSCAESWIEENGGIDGCDYQDRVSYENICAVLAACKVV